MIISICVIYINTGDKWFNATIVNRSTNQGNKQKCTNSNSNKNG